MNMQAETNQGVPIRNSLINKIINSGMLKWSLLIIPTAYVLLLLGVSLVGLLRISVMDDSGFTLTYISRFFTESVYIDVLVITFKIAFYVTALCLVLGYPVAYLMAKMENQTWKSIIFGIIFASFWISLLVRTFTWMILLQRNGIINNVLLSIGIIDEPLPLLYNTTGVIIGMTHILLPYMILSLYSVMQGIDQRLLQAAQGLGARPGKAFFQVFFPLSLPGVLSGSLIVFVMGIGYFITPALLGGSNDLMISELISDQVNVVLNWNFAAAISIILLVVTLVLLGISAAVLRRFSVIGEGR